MFPHATDEVRENNDKLSPCSIKHISKILKLKKDDCFVGKEEKMLPAESAAKCLHCALVIVNSYKLCVCIYLCLFICMSVPSG